MHGKNAIAMRLVVQLINYRCFGFPALPFESSSPASPFSSFRFAFFLFAVSPAWSIPLWRRINNWQEKVPYIITTKRRRGIKINKTE